MHGRPNIYWHLFEENPQLSCNTRLGAFSRLTMKAGACPASVYFIFDRLVGQSEVRILGQVSFTISRLNIQYRIVTHLNQ